MSRLLYSKQKEQRLQPLLLSHFKRGNQNQKFNDNYFFFEESSSSWLFIAMIYIITARITRYSMSTSYSSSSFPPNWKLITRSVSPLKFIPTGGTSIVYQNHTLITILFVNFIFYIQYINLR